MAFVLDTNVAMHLRDGDPIVAERVGRLDGAVLLSVVTRVELEGGVYRDPIDAPVRRVRLDAVRRAIPTLAFDDAAADVATPRRTGSPIARGRSIRRCRARA